MDPHIHFRTQHLTKFYDTVAIKFRQTRAKLQHSFELDHICQIINTYKSSSRTISILELWCGDWRLYKYLSEHCHHKFSYTGVDISQSMIALAHVSYPQTNRVVDDMNHYLSTCSLLTYDVIVSVAAYQHLPTDTDRFQHLQLSYQVLKYKGCCIMTNRSISYRMLHKHWKSYMRSFCLRLLTLGQIRDRNDLYIPFVFDTRTYDRYYHIFMLSELLQLYRKSGFIIQKACYIDNKWKLTSIRKYAKNTLIVWYKDILK